MGLVKKDDGWRIPDELWEQMEPLLPPRPKHPLGCHNPRVPDRAAMNAILLVLRTGMHWNALSATGVCSCSSAYRRFREWCEAWATGGRGVSRQVDGCQWIGRSGRIGRVKSVQKIGAVAPGLRPARLPLQGPR